MEIKNISKSEFLKLTVEPQTNQLYDIKLIETVPCDTLKLLINSSLLKQVSVLIMKNNNLKNMKSL